MFQRVNFGLVLPLIYPNKYEIVNIKTMIFTLSETLARQLMVELITVHITELITHTIRIHTLP